MPCYSRITSTVEFGDNTDVKLLAEALKSMGYSAVKLGSGLSYANYETGVSGQFRDGRLIFSGGDAEEFPKQLKRAYSAAVVKSAAQRFGWQVKQTSPTQLQVSRRS